MNLRLSVHELTPSGTVVYSETRSITTNLGGLFSVQIGSAGSSSSAGTLGGINWQAGDKYLQVEIDPSLSNNYLNLGTVQLVSVPYAIHAISAGKAVPSGSAGGDLTGTYPNPTVNKLQGKTISTTAPTAGQVLKWNGNSWGPADETAGSGSKGDKGEIGLTGAKGMAGADGAAGLKGDKGEIGLTGAQGLSGADGSAGAKGDKGETGLTGAQGVSGANGSSLPDATASSLGKIQLSGDLAGIASSPEVIAVGGSTAVQIHNAVIAANAATSQNTGNSLVSRDIAGDFSAGNINANLIGNVSGNLTGNVTGNVSGTAINVSGTIAVANGGTGSTSLTGYLKGDGINAMSASTTIPSTDITGLIKKVNGTFPDNNGNVAVSIGNVSTGIYNAFPLTGLTNGDMYVVSNDATVANNGRTYIYDGSGWNEITTNPAATDARYVQLGGSTMTGSLVFPSNTNLSLADAPSSATSAVNKSYVDTKLAAITIADASTSVIGKVQLTNDLGGTATSPSVISVGGSSAAAIHTAELLANSATSLTGNSTIVKRDASGNFSAGTISANLTGNVSGTANNVTGIVSIANGGTGASTAAGAKANLSLESVNNTADADKPMSNSTKTYVDAIAASIPSSASIQNGLNLKLDANKLGAINGAASLDANGKIPSAQLPAISIGSVDVVATQNAMLALSSAITGSVAIRTDLSKNYILTKLPSSNLSNWSELLTPGAPVQSVNGMVGSIALTKTEIGLDNADNTSDENKPLSADSRNALSLKANLASPALRGIPTAPTADAQNNSTQIATTAFVNALMNAVSISDASASTKGKIQLAGDLAGTNSTASVPIISSNAITTNKIADAAVTTDKIADLNVTDAKIAGLSGSKVSGNIAGYAANVTGTVALANGGTGATTATDARTNLGAEALSNKSTAVDLGNTLASDDKYPSQKSVKTYVDAQTAAAGVSDGSITNAKLAGSIAASKLIGTDITKVGTITEGTWNGTTVAVANGGTGASTLTGYVKGNGTGVLTASATIPASAITGLITKVNGSLPDANGFVTVPFGSVTTGTLATRPTNAGTNGNIYVVSGDTNTSDNGRTYISDGAGWNEVTSNQAATDARYLQLAGGTLAGSLTIPTAKVLTITDAPSNNTDATNKSYVDAAISNSTIADATSSSAGKIQLAGDLAGVGSSASTPKVGSVGGSTAALINSAEVLANAAVSANTANQIVKRDASGNFEANIITANLTGNATNVTGTVAVANGGTGAITAADARTNLGVEAISNKSTAVDLGSTLTSDDKYPSQKAVKTYVDAQTAAAGVSDGSITNAKLAGSISASKLIGTDITKVGTITDGTWNGTTLAVANGGTGATTLTGYVKGNGTSLLSASSSIPASDITGLIKKVNGSSPDVDGNVAISFGTVTTGTLASRPINAGTNGNIYVVSGDATTAENGRTFISDGTNWKEVTSNQSATDARYLKLAGGTVAGNIVIPTTNKITLTDAPTNLTDAVNKAYVDLIATNSTIANTTSSTLGKIQLGGDLTGVGTSATSPRVSTVGGSTAALINAAEIATNAATYSNTANQIVKRDGTGSFSANSITANLTGTVTGNATNVTGLVAGANGGTGVANTGKTITLGGNFQITSSPTISNFGLTFTTTNSTNVTLPTSGTLATLAQVDLKELTANKSTDVNLGTTLLLASDDKYPSQKAVKTYVDGKVAAAGVADASITNAKLAGSIAAAKLIGTDIATVGTITAGNWSATTIAVEKGGTGSTTYTDGQILMGKTIGNTLVKSTITAGSGISVTNGSGSITISNALHSTSNQFLSTIGQTSFTLTQIPSSNFFLYMFINGIRTNNTAYSWIGTTLTYVPTNNNGYALVADDRIQFDYYY